MSSLNANASFCHQVFRDFCFDEKQFGAMLAVKDGKKIATLIEELYAVNAKNLGQEVIKPYVLFSPIEEKGVKLIMLQFDNPVAKLDCYGVGVTFKDGKISRYFVLERVSGFSKPPYAMSLENSANNAVLAEWTKDGKRVVLIESASVMAKANVFGHLIIAAEKFG